LLTTSSLPSPFSRKARDKPTHARESYQMRRPPVGVRQASIGIRRMPSSNSLGQAAHQPNPSTQRLSTPLPALDENHALERVPSHSSDLTALRGSPSRLTKVKSAVQTRVPFWGNKKQQQLPDSHVPPVKPGYSMDYTSDMVDVLDTLGMCCTSKLEHLYTNMDRS
jgi:hypothetical protein